MAMYTVTISSAGSPDVVSLTDGSTFATLAVSAGRGPKGDGFTGGSYEATTGVVTFTSNDGLGFSTGDLRGDLSEPGPIGDVTPNMGAFTSFSTTGNAVIGGDLTVQGTTTTVDSTTVAVADKNIELAKDATTSAEADGGGITLVGAGATITYSSANDIWGLNKGLNVSGDVTLSGTVDGRDVSADGSKLDGIEANATADQTAAEIKTAYESNADTNAFTDAEQSKLLGIEANADATDTANVTAAGALMDSELTDEAAVKALNQGVATTDSPSFSGVTATEGTFSRLNIGADLEWNASTDSYTANSTPTTVTKVHQGMKRCVLNDDGSVNYYLDPTDSTKKLDGAAANIDGTDGNVMVEIPKFYFRQVRDGNSLIWQVSDVPLAGYQLHPAFFKNGEIVDFRYMGAYDACVYDDSAGTYIAGLNLDDNTGNIDTAVDKLASVSGVYPMVGVTRPECRSLAANNGSGWRQQDFWLTSAVQMLYLVEYGDFNSQANLGDGNTNGGYVGSSADQNDSPHTIAGASNSWGNAATDGSQPSAGAKPGTAYMSYRGIENFFGNCRSWVDGVNIGSGVQGDWHVSNTDTDFADSTTTNYEFLVNSMPSDGYVTDIADVTGAFIPSSTGGSSSTFLSDFFSDDNGNTNRVALFGGDANNGAPVGAFFWAVSTSSGGAARAVGARLAY